MNGPRFIDTDVFVYALDADEKLKQARAHGSSLPTQVTSWVST